jgi:D-alanyl-D-alanine carboxypeptidase
MGMTDDTNEEVVSRAIAHELISVIALIVLFLASIAVIVRHEYPRRDPQIQSQVASVAEAQVVFSDMSLNAMSAIVIDLTTGKILYALNPNIQLPLASLSKVPLALAVSNVLPADTIITIPYDTAPSGSAERLGKGEKWRLQDIIDFTLVASSNGGAEILARAANEAVREKYPRAPENSETIWLMNSLARQLGLNHTYFLNASGLDISTTLSGAYGSAFDVATLFAYAASQHLSVFSRTANPGLTLRSVNGLNSTSAFNTNEALGQIPGIIMGKTGITDLSGGNLAVVFDADMEHPVVAVVLGSTRAGRFSDMRQLVSKARIAVAQQKEVLATRTE